MFKNDGFNINDFNAKNISENNHKIIVELIWNLISHYTIEKSFGDLNETNENVTETNSKSKLLSWAVQKTQMYKNVYDFKPYDLAMCALLDSYYPKKINYYVLNLDVHQKNFNFVINVMEELGIPCLIYPEDLSQKDDKIDRKTLLTQLAFVRMVLENHQKEKHPIHNSFKENHEENLEKHENPEVLEMSDVDKKFEFGEEARLHAQIRAQRRARVVSRLQEHKSEDQIKKEMENHERRIKEEKEEEEKRNLAKKQNQIEKQIDKQFKENKKAYNKRKDEQEKEEKKLEKPEILIENEIAEEFKENEDAYKKRKNKH